MSSDIAIKVESLSKCYQIYDQPSDRLKQFILPTIQRLGSLPTKQYFREFWALKNVSFEIKKGETVGIIGRNGSGKSTLLQMIAGTLAPTYGSVETVGRIAALLELGSGFNSEFTGRENVYMNATLLGLTTEEIADRFDEIAAFADIGVFLDQPVKTYSSGMFTRLAFAVAINVDPDVLIVDEALSVGDALFQHKCALKMKNILSKGTTILFVSHSLNQIRNLCSRSIYLKSGYMVGYDHSNKICDVYMNDMTSSSHTLTTQKIDIQKTTSDETKKSCRDLFFLDETFPSKISKRSGNGEIEFVSICCYVGNRVVCEAELGQKLKVVASFLVNQDIPEGTAVGLHITDGLGNTLMALNSNFYDIYLPSFRAGEKRAISFEFEIPFMNIDLIFGIGAKPDPTLDYFYDRIFGGSHLKVTAPQLIFKKGIGGIRFVEDLMIELD